jgi:hypothetical protein
MATNQNDTPPSGLGHDAPRIEIDKVALQSYMDAFQEQFPAFTSFANPDGEYWRAEREYKDKLVACFDEQVRPKLSAVQSGTGNPAQLAQVALGLFSQPLQMGDGSAFPQNLVPWRQFDLLKDLETENASDFGKSLATLLDESQSIISRVDTFVPALQTIFERRDLSLSRSRAHAFTTFFLFLSDPTSHIFIKTLVFQRAIRTLWPTNEMRRRIFEGTDYEQAQRFSLALKAALEGNGLSPRDLIDIQSFLYCADRRLQKRDDPTPSAESSSEAKRPATDPETMPHFPLNQILYGPPGTGKTWQTTRRAVEIIDQSAPDDRDELTTRYHELLREQRIRFVTFHQSFSYEDFVEGIRPVLDDEQASGDGQVKYRCAEGVFRELANLAGAAPRGSSESLDLSNRRVYKISLGDTADPSQEWVYRDCIENGRIAINFIDSDFSTSHDRAAIAKQIQNIDPEEQNAIQPIHYIKNELREGDVVVVSDGNYAFRAVGEVTGPYQYQHDRDWFPHTRAVRWIRTFSPSLPVEQILGKIFSQRTLYRISPDAVNVPAMNALLHSDVESGAARNYVLIIDEINRANISRVFGELITLLESDKRIGADNETTVTLPYSGSSFGVPGNLYVIGTMNTADRSIALLDTALRRRFDFVEVAPDPSVLRDLSVDNIDATRLLSAINQRIEVLFDRDHRIGHAYFLSKGRDATSLEIQDLADTFEQRIIPLLEEYFFEDWERIRMVLADHLKPPHLQFIQPAYDENHLTALFGTSWTDLLGYDDRPIGWRKNRQALLEPEAYRLIYAGADGLDAVGDPA